MRSNRMAVMLECGAALNQCVFVCLYKYDKYIYYVYNGPNPDPESIQCKDYILLCKYKRSRKKGGQCMAIQCNKVISFDWHTLAPNGQIVQRVRPHSYRQS